MIRYTKIASGQVLLILCFDKQFCFCQSPSPQTDLMRKIGLGCVNEFRGIQVEIWCETEIVGAKHASMS